jgi:homoserine dehydrogenase
MEKVNVGILGFGTVGAGTVEVLLQNKEIIQDRVGSEIVIKRIADLDIESDRGINIDPEVLTTNAQDVIDDPHIDIVIELIGGIETPKRLILEALRKGKHVVTANKALLAECGKEIYPVAREQRVSLAFEASVGGGIPIIKVFKEGLAANKTNTIMGILNGTSNYILTRMAEKGIPYDEAVQEAIRLGYAEDPPTLDVDGTDAAHKLAILISLAYGVPVSFDDIYREGIDKVTPDDIRFGTEFGYCLKLLAVAKNLGDKLEARVHPVMIPADHILANVNDVYNAIYLEGDFAGPSLYYGLGAGRRPTGSAVASDVIDLAREILCGIRTRMPPLAHFQPTRKNISIQPITSLLTAYYFRFSAVDNPGVLSKISGILGAHDISISAVIQKGREINSSVPIVMLTHEAKESNVNDALLEMSRLDVLTDETVLIRVEEKGVDLK